MGTFGSQGVLELLGHSHMINCLSYFQILVITVELLQSFA